MDKLDVKFLFYPADYGTKKIANRGDRWAVQKEGPDGVKRNYLCGISSGMNVDAHGDYMSESCIKSFHDQANDKDILLYVNHGKDFTKDIGKLTKSEIIDDGGVKKWYTEYALYGSNDKVPLENREQADHIFRQAVGLPPYKKPRDLGFSIEGFIDPATVQNTMKGREIGFVDLDPGVTVVTKPAYTESMATAISKSLYRNEKIKKAEALMQTDEPKNPDDVSETTEDQQDLGGEYAIDVTPDDKTKKSKPKAAKSRFEEIIDQHRKDDSFYSGKWEIEDALHDGIDQVLESTNMNADQKKQEINDIIDSYKASTLSLLDQYGYDQIGDDTDSQNTSETVSNDALARARKAVSRLKSITKGQTNMNPELKTILSDVIASLQMLMQAEQSEAEGEMESPEMEASKAETEPDGDEATMKSLIAKMARLLKEEGAGSAEGDAEDIVEEVQPEVTPDDAEKFEKVFRTLMAKKSARKSDPELKALKSQVQELTNGMENLLRGFGLDRAIKAPDPVKKGYASHTGYEQLAKSIALLTQKMGESEGGKQLYGEARTPIQKNRNDLMEAFRAAYSKEV